MGSCKSQQKKKQVEQPKPLESQQSSKKTMTIQEFSQQAQQMKLVLIDNLIFKVDSFMINHPGKPALIEAVVGKDIGRYLNGTSCEIIGGQPSRMYTHSKSIYQELKEEFRISYLENPQFTFKVKQKQQQQKKHIEQQKKQEEEDEDLFKNKYEIILMEDDLFQ